MLSWINVVWNKGPIRINKIHFWWKWYYYCFRKFNTFPNFAFNIGVATLHIISIALNSELNVKSNFLIQNTIPSDNATFPSLFGPKAHLQVSLMSTSAILRIMFIKFSKHVMIKILGTYSIGTFTTTRLSQSGTLSLQASWAPNVSLHLHLPFAVDSKRISSSASFFDQLYTFQLLGILCCFILYTYIFIFLVERFSSLNPTIRSSTASSINI